MFAEKNTFDFPIKHKKCHDHETEKSITEDEKQTYVEIRDHVSYNIYQSQRNQEEIDINEQVYYKKDENAMNNQSTGYLEVNELGNNELFSAETMADSDFETVENNFTESEGEITDFSQNNITSEIENRDLSTIDYEDNTSTFEGQKSNILNLLIVTLIRLCFETGPPDRSLH